MFKIKYFSNIVILVILLVIICLIYIISNNCLTITRNARFNSTSNLVNINNKTFPSNFMFGIAAGSYQIEGAWNIDGKGVNIWDNFTHSNSSKILDGSNADVAANSYHLYEADIDLVKNLGVHHYRFSVSWSRILPKGFSYEVNPVGIEHYKNMIRLLRENNIEPIVTLYHWDLPQALQDCGGFLNESITKWFSDYARICFESFGDDVKYWSTFNEPREHCYFGYGTGDHAPGIAASSIGEYVCEHNMLKAHAAAWHIYNESFRNTQGGRVSINLEMDCYRPLTNSSEDAAASERVFQFYLGKFANPLYFGDYPDVVKDRIANRSILEGFNQSRLPEFTEEEKLYLKGTMDYFSVNTYTGYNVKTIPEPDITFPTYSFKDLGVEITAINESNGLWCISSLLKWIQNQYNDPVIIITENGWDAPIGVEDDYKISYIREYLSGIRDAIDDGVKVFGYTLWTLLDSFEWTSGYRRKMGIYHVDFDSDAKTRTPRKSAAWYKNVISTYCLLDVCEN